MSHIHDNYASGTWGGIIGLCNGFCLLSACEIIYWYTIRLFNDYRTDKKAKAEAERTHPTQVGPPPVYREAVTTDAWRTETAHTREEVFGAADNAKQEHLEAGGTLADHKY